MFRTDNHSLSERGRCSSAAPDKFFRKEIFERLEIILSKSHSCFKFNQQIFNRMPHYFMVLYVNYIQHLFISFFVCQVLHLLLQITFQNRNKWNTIIRGRIIRKYLQVFLNHIKWNLSYNCIHIGLSQIIAFTQFTMFVNVRTTTKKK